MALHLGTWQLAGAAARALGISYNRSYAYDCGRTAVARMDRRISNGMRRVLSVHRRREIGARRGADSGGGSSCIGGSRGRLPLMELARAARSGRLGGVSMVVLSVSGG